MTFISIIFYENSLLQNRSSLPELKPCFRKEKDIEGEETPTPKVKQRYHENSAWPGPAFGLEKPGYSSPEGTRPHFLPFYERAIEK